MLAVVEHHDAGLLGQADDRCLDRLVPERRGDGVVGHVRGHVRELGERDHLAVLRPPVDELPHEPRLADAAGSHERHAAAGGDELLQARAVVFATDEPAHGRHDVSIAPPGCRVQRWNKPTGRPVPRRWAVSLIVTIERSPVAAAATRWMLV